MLQYPDAVSEICAAFADPGPRRRRGVRPSTSSSGRPPAASSWRSRPRGSSGCRGFFAEEVKDADGTTRREFRRGFHLEPGSRVLLVDDILTTGGSLLTMLPPIEAAGARADARTVVIVDRSGGTRTSPRRRPGATIRSRRSGRSTSRPYEPGREHLPGVCRGATCRGAWLERHEGAVLTPLGCAVSKAVRRPHRCAVCSSSAPSAPSNLAATLPSAPTTKM